MLHCLQSPENLAGAGTDMTLLERQRGRLKWQHHPQQQQGEQESHFNDTHLHVLQFQGDNESITVKPDPDLENGYPGSGNYSIPITSFGGSELYAEMGSSVGKKRKSNKNQQNPKIVGSEDSNEKKMRGAEGEDTSKLTEQTNTRENSGDNSRDNSKVSEPQKPDYIHVRARRGQATDSHSLAERVRREKISERMKYLQELVPGCNKIIGKAGMLDEIINYVQSLQKQVEFLSMKLATVSPRLDFNLEDLFNKEMLPYCTNNISTVGALSEMINPAYFQFNPVQQVVSCGLDMGLNPPEMAPERARSTVLSVPENFLESPCFSNAPPSSTWDNDLQSIYNVAFNHGRSIDFPSQPFTGSLAANNLKMEM